MVVICLCGRRPLSRLPALCDVERASRRLYQHGPRRRHTQARVRDDGAWCNAEPRGSSVKGLGFRDSTAAPARAGMNPAWYLHSQGLDTSTPMGKAMFQIAGVFAELERSVI